MVRMRYKVWSGAGQRRIRSRLVLSKASTVGRVRSKGKFDAWKRLDGRDMLVRKMVVLEGLEYRW